MSLRSQSWQLQSWDLNPGSLTPWHLLLIVGTVQAPPAAPPSLEPDRISWQSCTGGGPGSMCHVGPSGMQQLLWAGQDWSGHEGSASCLLAGSLVSLWPPGRGSGL